jgi:ribose-phosphate pyrophosphokinase
MSSDILIVGVVSDDPFAIDVAHHFKQREDISDLISLKEFANTEFCPRFILDEDRTDNIGYKLAGKTVVIVSTCTGDQTRNALAMRTFLVARAAKDNGAAKVIVIQPDLFFSAQDRGPRREHGRVAFERSLNDYRKFDGQPFTAQLYAQLLKQSGVDGVVTVHNHSVAVQQLFVEQFEGNFWNLSPAELYAHYFLSNGSFGSTGHTEPLILCAPDAGASPFVREVYEVMKSNFRDMLLPLDCKLMTMCKVRTGERSVVIQPAPDSPTQTDEIAGRNVIVFDDMVRTGSTIAECCRVLKECGARNEVFAVTHFYASQEVKENLATGFIDQIVTTNTLPTILNRDMQGRLRKKMLVLKISKWFSNFLFAKFGDGSTPYQPPYSIDVSTKNPLWRPDSGGK